MAEAFSYHLFADAYGWTEAQVDATSDSLLLYLAIILDERAKEEKKQMKEATRR